MNKGLERASIETRSALSLERKCSH